MFLINLYLFHQKLIDMSYTNFFIKSKNSV